MITDVDAVDFCAGLYSNPAQFDRVIGGTSDDDICVAVKKYSDVNVIVFRGSVTVLDWLRDFQALMIPDSVLGGVETGFITGLRAGMVALHDYLQKPLIITGHSLGAARAALCAALCLANGYSVRRVITFGSPRPGGEKVQHMLARTPGAAYRNGPDPVTGVPLVIPLIEAYREPYPFTQVYNEPPDNDPWGRVMGWHHIARYQVAVRTFHGYSH